jgi:hypothetical protein
MDAKIVASSHYCGRGEAAIREGGASQPQERRYPRANMFNGVQHYRAVSDSTACTNGPRTQAADRPRAGSNAPGLRRARRAPVRTRDFKTASLAAKLADMCANASLIHGPWTMYYERFHGILSAEIDRGISIEE